jgi:hypothetical protein
MQNRRAWLTAVGSGALVSVMSSTRQTLILLAAIAATGVPARAEDNPLVGTWRLVSFERQNVDTKAVSQGYGGNAMGYVIYTPDGHVSFMVVDAKRKSPAQAYATDAEAISLYRTMNAYFGTYRVEGDQIKIHLDLSADQSDFDTTRTFKINGDRLTSTTPPLKSAFLKDQTTITTVVYERVR